MSTASPPNSRRKLLDRVLAANGRSLTISKSGWLHIVLCLGVGFAAINSGSNLLHVIFGVQLGLILISGILSERTLSRVSVTVSHAHACFANETSYLPIVVHNQSNRAPVFSITVAGEKFVDAPDFAITPVSLIYLAPGERSELRLPILATHRGTRAFPRLEVLTRFPFGLFEKRRKLTISRELTVFPEPKSGVANRRLARHDQIAQGVEVAARAGEVSGIRSYRDGDEVRRIRWRRFASHRRLTVCEFTDAAPQAEPFELRRGETGDPAFEQEISAITWNCLQDGQQGQNGVGLWYDGQEAVANGSGQEHQFRMLQFLAEVG